MNPELLSLKILTPEGSLLEADSLISISIPLADGGPIGIKPGHAPLIAETTQGTVIYRESGRENKINLLAGVLDIRDNLVIILTPGENMTMLPENTQPSETEYDRLMKTLVENFSLNQD